MDEVMVAGAERLAEQFAELPLSTVVRVLTDRAARHQEGPDQIEQAAAADLKLLTEQHHSVR